VTTQAAVRVAGADERQQLAALLAAAFYHDPVWGPYFLPHQRLPLYRRLGFEMRADVELPNGPRLWTMWREPGSGSRR
jgi:hypothetical protein